MSDFAVKQPLHLSPLHTAKTYWALVAALVIAGLLTTAFVIGRVTANSTERTITTVRPAAVQPVNAPQRIGVGDVQRQPAATECRVYQPC